MAKAQTVATAVVEAVAAHEGVDPTALDCRLHDAIDADALESLTTGSDRRKETPVRVQFRYHGYSITVDETGAVSVDDL